MKSIYYLLTISMFVLFFVASYSFASEEPLKTFTVQLLATKGSFEYSVKAPTDYMALDSVQVSGIYNKNIGKVIDVIVEETGLSLNDLPEEVFFVKTRRRIYKLALRTKDPYYAMTAIEATKKFLSVQQADEVMSDIDPITLTKLPEFRYQRTSPRGERAIYSIHAENEMKALVAIDIAVQLAKNTSRYDLSRHPEALCADIFN